MAPSDPGSEIFFTNSKGVTGHIQLDDLGLVHMGGRVYDPSLGRFTSADPFVQYPDDTQGFNRYTYVNNSPLTFADASGFGFFKSLGRAIKSAVGSIFSNPLQFLAAAAIATAAVAGCVLSGGTACPALLSLASAKLAAIVAVEYLGVQALIAAGQQLVYGNDRPKFLQRSERIAGALAAVGPPSRTIVGIGGGEIKLPAMLEQWTQAKTGSVIVNVDDDGTTQGEKSQGVLDALQAGLDATSLGLDASVAGAPFSFIPDLLNGVISAARGDVAGVGLSLLAAVPAIGAPANAARLGRAARRAEEVPPFLRGSRAGPRLHGSLPYRGQLREMATKELSELRDTTRLSLDTRTREIRQLGDLGGHGARIGDERRLLRGVEEELGNRGALID